MTQATSTLKTAVAAGRAAPGPRGDWLMGSVPEFRRDSLAFFGNLAREYGDVARVRFGPSTAYCLVHPDHYKQVLQDNNRKYIKSQFVVNLVRLASGENLFTSDGSHWLRQRRLMQPAFHRQRIAAWGAL